MNLDMQDIGPLIKDEIVYGDDPGCQGAVRRIAAIIGRSEWTVRDYLEGRIKMTLAFLHAAVRATSGNPRIRRFLEPEGFALVADDSSVQPDKDAEGELLDDVERMGALAVTVRALVHKGTITKADARRVEQCIRQSDEEWRQTKAAIQELIAGKTKLTVAL